MHCGGGGLSAALKLLMTCGVSLMMVLACAEPAPVSVELDLSGFDGGMERAPARAAMPVAKSSLSARSSTSAQATSELQAGGASGGRMAPQGSTATDDNTATSGSTATGDNTLAPGSIASQSVEPGGKSLLAATTIATTVYASPDVGAPRIGYIRLGGSVERSPQPVSGKGCKKEWYAVAPRGYVCTEEATTDLDAPLVRAAHVRPHLDKPLPYSYGFVRATAPQYLRIPTLDEQRKSEFQLDEHLAWYRDNYHEVQRVPLGANDVPLDARGYAKLGLAAPEQRLSTQLTTTELLGGSSPLGQVPFWLDGKRHIPNVSAFKVPEYALFADRVRRKTGLSFVDAFVVEDQGVARRFAVTVDMRLIPATKVKPDTASMHHGVELGAKTPLPLAFVIKRNTETWKLLRGANEVKTWGEPVPRRSVVPLTGHVRFKAGQRFYQTARSRTHWLRQKDVGVIAAPPSWPSAAEAGEKWIDVSLRQQVLVLYEGKTPRYATLVSTGRDRLGDPKETLATPQGEFRIQSKHIAAAMDSEENSSVSGGQKTANQLRLSPEAAATRARVLAAKAAGKKLSRDDQRRLRNVERGRHPEDGITLRRGTGSYELRDVPWIQYFAAGYALHGAYWHDVFGVPRSHGCINLSPIDARLVFQWTDPPVPPGFHGINTGSDFGQGTAVFIHE